MRSGAVLRNLLLILVSFLFVTLLVHFTGKITVYWYLYAIPIFVAAFTYDVVGGVVAGLASCMVTLLYMYQYIITASHVSPSADVALEIGIGTALLVVIGGFLGFLSKRYKSQQSLVETLARKDRVTGLNNCGYFIDRLTEEVKRSARYRTPCSLIMLDIDHFKEYEEVFGYEKSNLMLAKVARAIRRLVREVDFAARYGKEEFTIFLPATGVSEAGTVAERIRGEIEKTQFDGDRSEPVVKKTVSLGVASYPADASSEEELVTRAGTALNQARKTGHNKVCVYHRHCRGSEEKSPGVEA